MLLGLITVKGQGGYHFSGDVDCADRGMKAFFKRFVSRKGDVLMTDCHHFIVVMAWTQSSSVERSGTLSEIPITMLP